MSMNSSRGRKALTAFVLLGGALQAQHAGAACTVVNELSPDDARIDIGRVVIPAGAKPGDVVSRTASTPFGPKDVVAICDQSGGTVYGDYINARQRTPVPGFASVYDTDIAGLGIRMFFDGGAYLPLSNTRSAGSVSLPNNRMIVELIKTGESVASGVALQPGRLGGLYTDGSGQSRPYLTATLTGSVIVVSPTCEVQAGSRNISVDFGAVSSSTFRGIGSRSADRDFEIRLNCQGGSREGFESTVGIRLDAEQDSSNMPGVLKLSAAANSATRIGIQMIRRDGSTERELRFGQVVSVGVTATSSSVMVLPLRARYVQTEAGTVGAGAANGTATFTLQYN